MNCKLFLCLYIIIYFYTWIYFIIIHTMDIPTYVLLTTGSEWRWSNNSTQTNWYPNATLIRQTKVYNWDNVISTLRHMLLT